MRARGLKLNRSNGLTKLVRSRPMRARGLKHHETKLYQQELHVAPHAGAWVETVSNAAVNARNAGRAPCGRVG